MNTLTLTPAQAVQSLVAERAKLMQEIEALKLQIKQLKA